MSWDIATLPCYLCETAANAVINMNRHNREVLMVSVTVVTMLAGGGSLVAGAYLASKALTITGIALYAFAFLEVAGVWYIKYSQQTAISTVPPSRPETAETAESAAIWNPESDLKKANESVMRRSPTESHYVVSNLGNQTGFNTLDCMHPANKALIISTLFAVVLGGSCVGLACYFGLSILPTLGLVWIGFAVGLISFDYMYLNHLPRSHSQQSHLYTNTNPINSLPEYDSSLFENGDPSKAPEGDLKYQDEQQHQNGFLKKDPPPSSSSNSVSSLNSVCNPNFATSLQEALGLIKFLDSVNYTSSDRQEISQQLVIGQTVRNGLKHVLTTCLQGNFLYQLVKTALMNLDFAIIRKLWMPLCHDQFTKNSNRIPCNEIDRKQVSEIENIPTQDCHRITVSGMPSLTLASNESGSSGYDALFLFARHCMKQSIDDEEASKIFQHNFLCG